MKGCELCPGTARMFCESDQASLCFDCDAKVHGANFLVARHSRVLLCRSCQAPTPWKAAGPRLGRTVTVCDSCVGGRSKKSSHDDDEGESAARGRIAEEDDASDEDHQEEDVDDDDDDDDDDEMEEEDVDDDEEEGEEQVVPWSTEPLPPVASSSSSEEESTGGQRFVNQLKRNRSGNIDLPSSSSSQDQLPCSSSSRPIYYLPNRTALPSPAARTMADDNEATSDSFRPAKDRKKSDFVRSGSHQLSAISSALPDLQSI